MSSGSIGGLGGVAGSPYAQRQGADLERVATDTNQAQRGRQSQQAAESAAGIGETHEDAAADERDADGRRLWERTASETHAAEEDSEQPSGPPDPDQIRGSSLDVAG